MAMRNGTALGIGLAALLVFVGMSSTRAQFGDGPAGGQFGGVGRVGNSIDGPDWYTVNAAVNAQLETVDLSQLARRLAKAKPTSDPAQLMDRLNVFVRAGDRRDRGGPRHPGHGAYSPRSKRLSTWRGSGLPDGAWRVGTGTTPPGHLSARHACLQRTLRGSL